MQDLYHQQHECGERLSGFREFKDSSVDFRGFQGWGLGS